MFLAVQKTAFWETALVAWRRVIHGLGFTYSSRITGYSQKRLGLREIEWDTHLTAFVIKTFLSVAWSSDGSPRAC
jgi:hypothetical protein